MTNFIIVFNKEMTEEISEIYEDVIAILLDCLSIRADVVSSVTCNTTVSPFKHEINGTVASKLSRMMYNLDVKLGTTSILCPKCGSDEIFTCDDDDEMRECNNCGTSWEIIDDD